MIPVRRSQVAKPKPLNGADSAAGRERQDVINFYNDLTNKEIGYKKYKVYKHDDVKKALNALFHFKCAYCESDYGATQPVDIEHYRPKGGFIRDGKLEKPGYYWLAAEWSNLLPSCIDCNRARTQEIAGGDPTLSGKANLFPIANEQQRARHPNEERQEKRLLLDPCRDRPQTHLEFLPEGVVRAKIKSNNKPSQKGFNSIEVYGLLRRGLVQARRDRLLLIDAQIHRVKRVIQHIDQASGNMALVNELEEDLTFEMEQLHRLQEDGQPYAGMARQFIRRFLDSIQQ